MITPGQLTQEYLELITMALLNKNFNSIPKTFTIASISLLIIGMLFGLTGALQYVIPGLLKSHLSFEKIRPMHVSSIIFWIIIGSVGAVFNYLQLHTQKKNILQFAGKINVGNFFNFDYYNLSYLLYWHFRR